MSTVEVGTALGLNRATIYRYESDSINKLPTEVIIPLASVLQTTPEWLMGWDDDPEAPPPNNILDDPAIAAIATAALRLNPGDRKRLLDMIKLMFPSALED